MLLNVPDGSVEIAPQPDGLNRIVVYPTDPKSGPIIQSVETTYPVDLIEAIAAAKGIYVCDEIARDHSPDYVQADIRFGILSYFPKTAFVDRRLLDFGCGAGASSVILAKMFPDTEIVGVDLEDKFLEIARRRSEFYGQDSIEFRLSPDPNSLPDGIGLFDFVNMTGVFEHLLPGERPLIMGLLWAALKPGGVIFLYQTPHRYYPVETHTTGGLPMINYMPDALAGAYARQFSQRELAGDSWEVLLRKGLRGGSVREIRKILCQTESPPIFLKPDGPGIRDTIDVWYASTSSHRSLGKRIAYVGSKVIRYVTGMEVAPYLSLAIEKGVVGDE
jgi:2-polyprenyl-3-methyl-5-hydroxy-6-metoxy-1,4-benzoquinol methylase